MTTRDDQRLRTAKAYATRWLETRPDDPFVEWTRQRWDAMGFRERGLFHGPEDFHAVVAGWVYLLDQSMRGGET